MRIIRCSLGIFILGLLSLGAHAANVLIVLSDAHQLELKDGKTYPTGFFLNELMQPVKLLRDAGHSLTFATPYGNAPAVDPASLDKMYFNNDEQAFNAHQSLLTQLKILSPLESPVVSLARVEQMGYQHFDALYIPGGHAPMQDLLHSVTLGKLLKHFHEAAKTTALVCHGPIALLSTLDDAQGFSRNLERGIKRPTPEWIYAGYKMTVISNLEEEQAKGMLQGGEMKFYPQTALVRAGARYTSNSEPWTAHMVIDRELITGQNPASALTVANELLQRLDK